MQAQYNLGLQYDKGDSGLVEDQVEAARWFERAASLGNVNAQRCLGDMFIFGDGVERSYTLASE